MYCTTNNSTNWILSATPSFLSTWEIGFTKAISRLEHAAAWLRILARQHSFDNMMKGRQFCEFCYLNSGLEPVGSRHILKMAITNLTAQDLIDFEIQVAASFNASEIRAPVHLYYGNEEQMLKVFTDIKKEDWVMCSWRSHYQCLLKGVPAARLMEDIQAGKSISLCFPEYRIVSSAIVTGIVPIAVGIALAIKRHGDRNKVYCFLGEMTAETGIAHECFKYSKNHDLPIRFIIEDNGKSVCTDTREVWRQPVLSYENTDDSYFIIISIIQFILTPVQENVFNFNKLSTCNIFLS